MGYRRIYVGVSGSIASLAALRAGVDLVRRGGLAELHVVHAWSLPAVDLVHGPCTEVLDSWRDEAAVVVRVAFEQAMGGPPEDLRIHPHLVAGPARDVLLHRLTPQDLLVLGESRPAGPLARLLDRLSGSVARSCVGRAPCPVLVVPPPDLPATLSGHFRGRNAGVSPRN